MHHIIILILIRHGTIVWLLLLLLLIATRGQLLPVVISHRGVLCYSLLVAAALCFLGSLLSLL